MDAHWRVADVELLPVLWDRTMSDVDERLNDIEARMDALNRARMNNRDRIEKLEEKVDRLLRVVEENPEQTAYKEMSRQKKVHRIRCVLLRQALDSNGTGKMEYKEVKALFNGHPSNSHCYDLMEYAGEMEGFDYQSNPKKRVVVESNRVTDDAVLVAAKKEYPKATA